MADFQNPVPTAFEDCEATYAAIRREFVQLGLDLHALELNRVRDARVFREQTWVKVRAYKPTGLAVGCPLPDRAYQNAIWQLARDLEQFLATIVPQGRGATFAYVPPEFYHVTAVNYSHFDHRATVRPLGRRELSACRAVVSAMSQSPVTIAFRGLLLTRSGRLLVLGHPQTAAFFELRERLLRDIPELRENAPRHAAMKIGHLLAPLDRGAQNVVAKWLEERADTSERMVTFDDAYTQLGRIDFGLGHD